jgi:hypothetical protein
MALVLPSKPGSPSEPSFLIPSSRTGESTQLSFSVIKAMKEGDVPTFETGIVPPLLANERKRLEMGVMTASIKDPGIAELLKDPNLEPFYNTRFMNPTSGDAITLYALSGFNALVYAFATMSEVLDSASSKSHNAEVSSRNVRIAALLSFLMKR